ncbi:PREDICTED: SUN domain-containing protein 2 [Ceratosolen solmsi marchali]|uniref:SUN domain-containing protein 2 n=1 Tax=Ceratosolen solmsi marchali TaxID=326594 RepID=A0AAJ6YQT1_9HYME|nr:PREDICTED: SUN domain-containing protein 2 [Ceratosolen solmsi marchali]
MDKTLGNCKNNINLADFASEAIGGMVIATPNTRTYNIPKSVQITLFGIPVWKPNYFTPRKVIQPWSQAGECWAFRGSQGKIEIELAHTAIIERVTLEHISSSASLTGKITSAPKIFNVLGKIKTDFVKIDAFVYKDTGLPSQTFEIKEPKMKNTPFKRIMLEILSNWGNTNYTCIYRFKVHGKIYHKPNKKESHTIVQ